MKKYQMTASEVASLIGMLREIFDIVRLVDVSMTKQVVVDLETNIQTEEHHCYEVWGKTQRCENCISAKAFAQKTQVTKFEFVDNDIFYVVAKYVEIDAIPYVLEMVLGVKDQSLFGAYGKGQFVSAITQYNNKLYLDSLTGVYNRRYFDEQLQKLQKVDAVAMIDLDHFKHINDTFGHQAGDIALKTVVQKIKACVRPSDEIIRYGGDEFYLVFRDIPKDIFEQRLRKIRKAVHEVMLSTYPDMRLSVSIGGIYCAGTSGDLIKIADDLLYQAKEKRNHVCVSILMKHS